MGLDRATAQTLLRMHYDPQACVMDLTRLTGGVSAEVYRLDVAPAASRHNSEALEQVVLRLHGPQHNGHCAQLEFDLLHALHSVGLPVPRPLSVQADAELAGYPFLLIEYIQGSTHIAAAQQAACIAQMATMLRQIHESAPALVPFGVALPQRLDPLPEVFDYLPEDASWNPLRRYLHTLGQQPYVGPVQLLHGDFWPENLLWRAQRIRAVLDWEDAAFGDPLSDVAAARVELRYRFGPAAMQQFTRAYTGEQSLDTHRLALWQVYVAAAAQHFMAQWGLPASQEAHMRSQAVASLREAAAVMLQPTSADCIPLDP